MGVTDPPAFFQFDEYFDAILAQYRKLCQAQPVPIDLDNISTYEPVLSPTCAIVDVSALHNRGDQLMQNKLFRLPC